MRSSCPQCRRSRSLPVQVESLEDRHLLSRSRFLSATLLPPVLEKLNTSALTTVEVSTVAKGLRSPTSVGLTARPVPQAQVSGMQADQTGLDRGTKQELVVKTRTAEELSTVAEDKGREDVKVAVAETSKPGRGRSMRSTTTQTATPSVQPRNEVTAPARPANSNLRTKGTVSSDQKDARDQRCTATRSATPAAALDLSTWKRSSTAVASPASPLVVPGRDQRPREVSTEVGNLAEATIEMMAADRDDDSLPSLPQAPETVARDQATPLPGGPSPAVALAFPVQAADLLGSFVPFDVNALTEAMQHLVDPLADEVSDWFVQARPPAWVLAVAVAGLTAELARRQLRRSGVVPAAVPPSSVRFVGLPRSVTEGV